MASSRTHDFPGPKGDESRHLPEDLLLPAFEALPQPPSDRGRVDLIVSRGPDHVRATHEHAELSPERGIPGDAWFRNQPERLETQVAVMRSDVAKLLANGQDLTLFGDNLLLDLDLSTGNLPTGSRLRIGDAELRVTPEPHNGCLQFRQRFGGDALRLTADKRFRDRHLRGIYLQVVKGGAVSVGDAVVVLSRPVTAA
jgi:hypothetical protein